MRDHPLNISDKCPFISYICLFSGLRALSLISWQVPLFLWMHSLPSDECPFSFPMNALVQIWEVPPPINTKISAPVYYITCPFSFVISVPFPVLTSTFLHSLVPCPFKGAKGAQFSPQIFHLLFDMCSFSNKCPFPLRPLKSLKFCSLTLLVRK